VKVLKYLSFGLKNKTGVNVSGRRTVLSKGTGRPKRKFRLIDFNLLLKIPGLILRIEYDPNRNSSIALICYKNGFLSYILAVNGMQKNQFINTNVFSSGSIKQLKEFSLGTFICCVELRKDLGAKISRSAGCSCLVLSKDNAKNRVCLRLPSGEERNLNFENYGVLGIVLSNQGVAIYKKKKKLVINFFLVRNLLFVEWLKTLLIIHMGVVVAKLHH